MGIKENLPVGEWHESARALAGRFVQRRDLYARQLEDGRYVAVYEPLEVRHLIAHLRGEMTLGAYALDCDSQGRFIVLDADDDPDWRRLKALAGVLSGMDCPAYLEHSRRGGHLWLFFAQPLPGRQLRQFGKGLLHHFGIEEMELFPKQDRLRTGPGSLIRLPFGVHRKSGRRYGFYTADEPLAPSRLLTGTVVARYRPGDTHQVFPPVNTGPEPPAGDAYEHEVTLHACIVCPNRCETQPEGRAHHPSSPGVLPATGLSQRHHKWNQVSACRSRSAEV